MKKVFTIICFLLVFTAAACAQELTFEQLTANVEKRLSEIADLQAVFELEMVESGQTVVTKMDIKWIKEQNLYRINFLYPDIVAGQFYIIDGEKEEMAVYITMANMLMVMSVKSAAQYGFSLPITDFEQSFTFANVKGEIVKVEQTDKGLQYMVKISEFDQGMFLMPAGTNPDGAVQYAWIDANYMPVRFEYWESDVCLAKLLIQEYAINSGISAEELRKVPENATRMTF